MATTTITYNGNTISSADETVPVSVTYNGNQIASIAGGETKTLECNDKYMRSNVVIGSKTLNCAKKIMASNVVISVESSTQTWIFNETLGFPSSQISVSINFISNGTTYSYIIVTHMLMPFDDVIVSYDNTDVYDMFTPFGAEWLSTEYRTITFLETPSGDLLDWLLTNAVKQ